MTNDNVLSQLLHCVRRTVVVVSGYIPDKPRSWEGVLQGDAYGSYWVNGLGETEVNFSSRDVDCISFAQTPCHIYLTN